MHWPGDKIRREREARGLSQQQLAHLLSAAQPDNTTSTRSVTAWENGESRPSGRNLAALDRVFATTPLPTDILADLPAGSRDDLIAWALDEASDMQLLATLARRMGASRSTSLPDTDLRLPRRHGHTEHESGAGST